MPEGYRWCPFCSCRCELADFGTWLDEAYMISPPLRADDIEDEEHLV